MRKVLVPVFLAAVLTACAQSANTTAGYESAMLNEIYATKITNVATQRTDVNGIVTQYLPIGTSREKALAFLGGLGEGKVEESSKRITYSTHQGEGIKGNRRDIRIEIQLNHGGSIESVSSFIDKSNNL